MKYYVVSLSGKNQKTLTPDLLKSHIEFLKDLDKRGTLVLCGPFEDDDSAIQIYKVSSIEEAETIINQDPFISESYYQSYSIKTLLVACNETNWLESNEQTNNNLQD